jgi:crotonobetainyl-CoA:carnitine CoA-transferase CaiB-like acyl-CoA transferase
VVSAPLDGLRVLDLTRFVAGSQATATLAALGAEVIKLEVPPGGDPYRVQGTERVGDQSVLFMSLNSGKRSVALDMRAPDASDAIERLLGSSDFLVENARPGSLARHGLDWDSVHARHPSLVYGSISGYGDVGPDASRGGFDLILQAESGVMSVTGSPQSGPVKVGAPVLDVGAGMSCALGLLAAHIERLRTGEGRHVDVSLMDAALTMIEFPLATFLMTGQRPPSDVAARRAGSSPNQVFRARDGMVLINAPTQDQWNRLLKVMGREELVTDPRFNTPLRRQDPASAVAIESLVGDWMRSLSVDEAYRALVAADVPAAPVRTIDQVAADPQVEHRRMVQGVRHPQSGLEMRLTGNPVKLSGLRDEIGHPAVRGEHNYEIYGKWLGLDADAIADLTRRKII